MQVLRDSPLYIAAARLGDNAAATDRRERRRRQSAATRALAAAVVEKATRLSPAEWDLMADVQGRPLVARKDGRTAPDLSISHCRDVAACAVVHDGRIGIDVEQGRAGRRYREIANAFLSPAECQAVAANGGDAFLTSWVLREAMAKAEGTGLAGALALPGDWIAGVHDATRIVTVNDRRWIVAHRAHGDLHLAIAWLPGRLVDGWAQHVDGEIDRAMRDLAPSP